MILVRGLLRCWNATALLFFTTVVNGVLFIQNESNTISFFVVLVLWVLLIVSASVSTYRTRAGLIRYVSMSPRWRLDDDRIYWEYEGVPVFLYHEITASIVAEVEGRSTFAVLRDTFRVMGNQQEGA